jgi:hypothetical protein
MRKEIFILKIERYRDKDGMPCCALDFETHDVCQFWASRKMGQLEFCAYAGKRLYRRGEDRLGTLIPCAECPVWPSNHPNS